MFVNPRCQVRRYANYRPPDPVRVNEPPIRDDPARSSCARRRDLGCPSVSLLADEQLYVWCSAGGGRWVYSLTWTSHDTLLSRQERAGSSILSRYTKREYSLDSSIIQA